MPKIVEKLKEEFFAILPPTIFFFVMLHIMAIIRVLMDRGGSHFVPMSTTSIAVASLILGKAVLIADMIPVINRYPNKPLAYNVVWKTLIYLLLASVIHYLERLIDFSRHAGGIVAGNESCWRKSCGRISGHWRSCFSCRSLFTARHTNSYA